MNKVKENKIITLEQEKLNQIEGGSLTSIIRLTGFGVGTITKLLQCHLETGNSITFIYQSNFNN